MAQVVITRKFRLDNLNIADDLFVQYKRLVNDQIRHGLNLPYSVFEKNTLVAVKKFYRLLQNCSCDLKERVHRCGAQYSYFALREYRRNQKNLIVIINILINDGIFSNNHNEILNDTDLSYYEIDNKLNFLKNQLITKLVEPDITQFYKDTIEFSKYNSEISKNLNDKDFIAKTFKSFTNRVIRRLNRRFKQLHDTNYAPQSNYDTTILKLLNLQHLSEVSNISKRDWQKSKIKWKQDLKHSFSQVLPNWKLNNWNKKFDNLLVDLLKPKDDRLWVNGASLADLLNFMELQFDTFLKNQILEYLKINLLAVINHELSVFEQDLDNQIPNILKIPEMKRSSIAVGIDDGQVYRLNEITENNKLRVQIKVSLQANDFVSTDLRTVDRYTELLNKGFKSQRGVLHFSRGKYFVYIPFTKKASEERDNDLIASADLGLKTFTTLSIYNKTKEIDRQFLDQKDLVGKKTDWFKKVKRSNNTNELNKLNKLDLKGKLMDRRLLTRVNQSIRMMSRKGTMRHWFARDGENKQWSKISNVHKELIRQISTRIISYLNYHNVGTLVLENLKWSTHSSRWQSGYFLATWQIHWFFSQVQSMVINQARLHGIRVELVNPKNSSKICYLCGKMGNRVGKQFYCTNTSCQIKHLDSDLNAARNLVQRSKKYKRYIRYNLSQFSDAIS